MIANAFKGIKIGVGVLIFDAGLTMFQKMKKKTLSCVILAASVVVMLLVDIFSWNFSSISLMLIAAAVGLCAWFVDRSRKEGKL